MIPDYILAFIFRWEGKQFTDSKNDLGGATNYGISQKNHPNTDVSKITELDAIGIYTTEYWLKAHCHELPEFMQLVQMNCAVNCGVGTANKTLQKTLKVKVDGHVGKQTLGAAQAYSGGVFTFLINYGSHQAMYYFNIVHRRREQHKWLRGWARRTLAACMRAYKRFG